MNTQQPILLFDGVCNLCNGVVQFIIERDPKGKFLFTSLQSEQGQALLKKHQLPTQQFDSFVLLEGDKYYQKSTAALKIAQHLGGAWSLLGGFMFVPPFIRDAVYAFVAKNRYKWFGKEESCWLPTPELKKRFL